MSKTTDSGWPLERNEFLSRWSMNTIGLLVSVRSAAEALVALQNGVDIIDIKEPDQGPLGRAAGQTIAAIVDQFGQETLASVALGEIGELATLSVCDFLSTFDPAGRIRFAKVGHADMAHCPGWIDQWQRFVSQLPQHVLPVAVGYIDSEQAASPPVGQIIARGASLGCRVLLLDTFDKTSGSIFDQADVPTLLGYRKAANAHGMALILAGSIRSESLPDVVAVAPQLVGVRGAACRGYIRGSTIDACRLSEFRSRLKSQAS